MTLLPSGLLQHSLEVAKYSVAMLRLNEPTMPRLMQEACFVGGLLHDIGKTYTYDAKSKPNAAWKLCSHDVFTLWVPARLLTPPNASLAVFYLIIALTYN